MRCVFSQYESSSCSCCDIYSNIKLPLWNLLFALLLCFSITIPGKAQTDTEFWFVVPEVTRDHNGPNNQPSFFNITTKNLPATVTITMPENPLFADIIVNVPANSTEKVVLSGTAAEYKQISNRYTIYDGIAGKNNRGFHIQSTSLITVYFEYSNGNNPDIWALKGTNALGTEFYTSFQTGLYNMNFANEPAYSAIDIVATEDNTSITVDLPPGKEVLGFAGLTSFVIDLDRGETFTLIPSKQTEPEDGWKANDQMGRAGADRLTGVRLTSNNKIAVSLKDDSMRSAMGGTCYDLAGDQTIPLEVAGKEYVAMLGQLEMGAPSYTNAEILPTDSIQERLYIVGTQFGDSIFINDVFYKTLQRGQTVSYRMLPQDPYVHVRTNHKSYVLQHTGFGCEFGQAILPPIDKCTGSTEVGFTRSTRNAFYMNIMVRKGAEDGFTVYSDGVEIPNLITAADFDTVPGTDEWLAFRSDNIVWADIDMNQQSFITNSKDVFHLGLINGEATGGGTRFGYFSNFNEFKVGTFNTGTGSQNIRACYGDKIQLVATGGLNVEWIPNDYLDDPYSLTPIASPPVSIQYTATVAGMCNMFDSSEVSIEMSYPFHAQLTIDKVIGCAPMEVTFHEKSKGYKGKRWNYGFGQMNYEYKPGFPQDTTTLDTTFTHTYFNVTDTIKKQKLILITYNQQGCRDTATRTLHIKPMINAGFNSSDTIGCHPLYVNFENTSSGDTNFFDWDFGNGAGDYGTHTEHTFYNFGDADTTFTTTLEAVSPFLCRDTATQRITVHPYLIAKFSIDSASGCGPIDINIKDKSFGIDTFYWEIYDTSLNQLDTAFVTDTASDYQLQLDNDEPVSLVKRIKLVGKNVQNCYDSLTHYVTIYPSVRARFSMSEPAICDSTIVSFTNHSEGFNLSYFWDFKDNNTSTLENPTNRFQNKSDTAITRNINLTVENEFFCKDDTSMILHVFPFIQAKVGLDTATGCHPFKLNITNNSIGVDNYQWNFGDGSAVWDTAGTSFIYTYLNESFDTTAFFPFKLIVGNVFGCKDTLNNIITVYPAIQSGFTVDRYYSCDPALFHFTSTAQGASSYYWDFKDGSSSMKKDSVSHLFPKNNTTFPIDYNVSLQVTSESNHCFSIFDSSITVYPYIKADFSVEEYAGCAPFVVSFDNNSIGQLNAYKWYVNGTMQASDNNFATTLIQSFIKSK